MVLAPTMLTLEYVHWNVGSSFTLQHRVKLLESYICMSRRMQWQSLMQLQVPEHTTDRQQQQTVHLLFTANSLGFAQ